MSSRIYLFLAVPLFLTGALAQAGGTKEVDQARAARRACLTGDYTKGVAILTDLFVDTEDPTYIYNQGRCFEQNLRYRDAIGRFQEYLRVAKKLTRAEKADAELHIAECERLQARQDSQPVPSVAPHAQVVPVTPVAPLEPKAAPSEAAAQPIEAAGSGPAPTPAKGLAAPATQPLGVQGRSEQTAGGSGARLRTAGLITAAAGGAALIGGLILNLKANSITSDMLKVDGYTDGKASDRKTWENVSLVGYGVGAGCVVTGAILYYLGSRSTIAASTSVAFVPSLAPGQASAIVKGSF